MKLEEIGRLAAGIQDGGKFMVITEKRVAEHYLQPCVDSLEAAGFQVFTMILPTGEETKSGATYLSVLNEMASDTLTRTDGVVALGGGMIGDLAGFAAATYLRGIKVIQVPTTLLAAVDSSVGGKTAINLPEGKNLAGAFHQPALVLQDAELLKSLPESVLQAGLAEVIKYGVIADEKLFCDLKDVKRTRENLEPVVERCVAIKRKYVEADEFDLGVRHLLNFGHTIGHAIEKKSRFTLSHGHSVAKGMAFITAISAAQGWCDLSVYDDLQSILIDYGFDLSVPWSDEDLVTLMCSDKKREGSTIDLVIPERIGTCTRRKTDIGDLLPLLQSGRRFMETH